MIVNIEVNVLQDHDDVRSEFRILTENTIGHLNNTYIPKVCNYFEHSDAWDRDGECNAICKGNEENAWKIDEADNKTCRTLPWIYS